MSLQNEGILLILEPFSLVGKLGRQCPEVALPWVGPSLVHHLVVVPFDLDFESFDDCFVDVPFGQALLVVLHLDELDPPWWDALVVPPLVPLLVDSALLILDGLVDFGPLD